MITHKSLITPLYICLPQKIGINGQKTQKTADFRHFLKNIGINMCQNGTQSNHVGPKDFLEKERWSEKRLFTKHY